MSNVIHLTTPAFASLAAQGKPVIIDFWAPWCGPCRAQGPIVEEVAAKAGAAAVVAKVNVDEEPALARQFGIQAIPTLVVVKDGATAQRLVGLQSAKVLLNALGLSE